MTAFWTLVWALIFFGFIWTKEDADDREKEQKFNDEYKKLFID